MPYSDERSQAIATPLYLGVKQCLENGRQGNEFIVHKGERCFVFVKLPSGAALFILHGIKEVDHLLNCVRRFVTKELRADPIVEALGDPEEQPIDTQYTEFHQPPPFFAKHLPEVESAFR